MARACIFCGDAPVTREHVWPNWARRLVTHAPPLDYHREFTAPDVDERRSWRQGAFEVTVRAVCAPCNNGWMSRLEHQAQQRLEPMLRGRGQVLDENAQDVLAAWAVKTALIVERSAGDDAPEVFPRAVPDSLFREHRPPSSLRIWIGAYEGTLPGFASIARTPPTSARPATGYAATLVFGPVLFYVLGGPDRDAMNHRALTATPGVAPISPHDGQVQWAPQPNVDDDFVWDLSDALA